MKGWRGALLGCVSGLLTCASSFAQSPQPRLPLEPGTNRQFQLPKSFEPYAQLPYTAQQLPPHLRSPSPTVDASSIVIVNRGNARLSFSTWDGTSWKPQEIAPGATVTIACTACGGTISVAFHNGAENTTTDVSTGARYTFFWSETTRKWALGKGVEPNI